MKQLFFIGEIGINHNGDLDTAKRIIDIAVVAGCTAVKFQKRTPELCVPEDQKNIMRETPWGLMTYLEYKRKIEFGENEFDEIDKYCKEKGIDWFASAWDLNSIDFLSKYNLKFDKIASALLTDKVLLSKIAAQKKHTFVSTGMSSLSEISDAVDIFRKFDCPFTVMHCTSSYPCSFEEVNLKMINTLKVTFPDSIGVGFSDHTKGIIAGPLAVSLGATVIEKHITNDRSAFGTDQSNSLEEKGLKSYIRDCHNTIRMLGDGIKKVYSSELPVKNKLRKV